jgi:hypothetical protein
MCTRTHDDEPQTKKTETHLHPFPKAQGNPKKIEKKKKKKFRKKKGIIY